MNLFNLIKYINFRFREKKKLATKMKSYFKTNSEFLTSGTYSLAKSESGKIIAYKHNSRNKFFVEKIVDTGYIFSDWQNRIKSNIRQFVDLVIDIPTIKIKSLKPSFNGELIMVTYNQDVKIFDLKSKTVVNLVKDNHSYLKLIKTTNIFKDYFDIPIISSNPIKQTYIERFIDFKPYSNWSLGEKEDAVRTIFSNYKNYFIYCSANSHFISRDIRDELAILKNLCDGSELLATLSTVIKNSLDSEWTYVNCHGDMVFSNILLYKKNYYIIDWIDSGKHIFFYDLFNFMFGEATFHRNYYYLEKFISGTFDHYLSGVFKLFNHTYDKEKKIYYLALFLINRIRFRIENKNDENLVAVFSSYHDTFNTFVKKIKSMEKKTVC
ncbi:hypothetical protein ACFVAD_00135 [Sutcliffiella sp. NPDC057660]|uniref:hypothetical protein n=1 Tax=Sutcliffiella sp. NPDC057660 TaxID=3346199 RepID=UPI003699C5E8